MLQCTFLKCVLKQVGLFIFDERRGRGGGRLPVVMMYGGRRLCSPLTSYAPLWEKQVILRSRCGQSFTNSPQHINVLYSTEQTSLPLGSAGCRLSAHCAVSLQHACSVPAACPGSRVAGPRVVVTESLKKLWIKEIVKILKILNVPNCGPKPPVLVVKTSRILN